MAKLGGPSQDPRWLVAERNDGTNVNGWHWQMSDMTEITKAALKVSLEAPTLLSNTSSKLRHCALTKVVVRGDCSVTTRKGKRFLICELDVQMVWTGELKEDNNDHPAESASGSIHLPDVSPETLDDLEATFTTDSRGSPLSELMRKEGVAAIKRAVCSCMRTLEAKMAEMAERPPQQPQPPQQQQPQPVSISDDGTNKDAAGWETIHDPAKKPPPPPTAAAAAAAVAAAQQAAKPPPEPLKADSGPGLNMSGVILGLLVKKLHASPKGHITSVRLPACGIEDSHMPTLIEILHASNVTLTEIDLSFNELTEKGVLPLLDALKAGAQDELTTLHLGGNATLCEDEGGAVATRAAELTRLRPDLHIDWAPQLHGDNLIPCTHIGLVYKNSPAASAGLLKGDQVLQWGMLQKGRSMQQRFGFQPSMQDGVGEVLLSACQFRDVSSSISPLVRAFIGLPTNVIVRRPAAEVKPPLTGLAAKAPLPSDGTVCVKLSLTPERWSGQGLLGCILK